MLPSTRLLTLCLGALLCGFGVATLVSGADARAKKVRAGAKARAPLTASKGRGRGHVPRALLGPRWALVGNPQAPAGTTTTTAPVPTYTVPATTNTTTTPPVANALGVRLCDAQCPPWRVQPTSTTLTPGQYAVQMQNYGEDPHDLVIIRESDGTHVADFPQLAPGNGGRPSVASRQVDFSSPGTYTLFCSLPGGPGGSHYASGMVRQVTVTTG